MKKSLILITLMLTTFLISCEKKQTDLYIDCDMQKVDVPPSEIDSLNKYVAANAIPAIYDEGGFYYIIENVGEELKPDRCYSIRTDYKVYNFNGVFIDNGTNSALRMHHLIAGFQLGTHKIGKGGKIKIFLPPTLGYGEKGSSPAVGSNEYLIFEITLIDLTFNNIK